MNQNMNQNEVRELVSAAAQSTFSAYWNTDSTEIKGILSGLVTNLNTLLTKLDQQDLTSRTDDFIAATNLMQKSILPEVKQLDTTVEKIINVENSVKTALDDVLKLSMTGSFFSLPAL